MEATHNGPYVNWLPINHFNHVHQPSVLTETLALVAHREGGDHWLGVIYHLCALDSEVRLVCRPSLKLREPFEPRITGSRHCDGMKDVVLSSHIL